eukprot:2767438-Prymnesium_polylepis.2
MSPTPPGRPRTPQAQPPARWSVWFLHSASGGPAAPARVVKFTTALTRRSVWTDPAEHCGLRPTV